MTSLAQSLLARIRKQLDVMRTLSEQSNAISVEVTSRDKSVSATVTSTGELTDLRLAPHASRLGAEALARLIVETAQAACQVALDRQGFLYQEFTAKMEELNKTPLQCWDGSMFVPGEGTVSS